MPQKVEATRRYIFPASCKKILVSRFVAGSQTMLTTALRADRGWEPNDANYCLARRDDAVGGAAVIFAQEVQIAISYERVRRMGAGGADADRR